MVSETVFYMDIKEAGTVRGGVNCFFFFFFLRGKMKNAENFDSR